MSPPRRIALFLTFACWCGQVQSARAAAGDPVEAAERAYRDVDFEAQRTEARRALEAGNHPPTRLAEIYRLLGIAHAALGQPEAAKQAFLRLLALDPNVELERFLSPRLRSPYMEARGFWDVTSARLGVDAVSLRQPQGATLLRLGDPLGMVARVRLRTAGAKPDVALDLEIEAASELRIVRSQLQRFGNLDVQLELLDEFANVLLVRSLPRAAAPPAEGRRRADPRPELPPAPKLYYPSLFLVSAGAIGVGVGAFAQVLRERKAREWNGAGCEQPGQGTRAEQCSGVDDERTTAQRVAVASYSAGGALLLVGVVSQLLFTHSSTDHRAPGEHQGLTCGSGPGELGLACHTSW